MKLIAAASLRLSGYAWTALTSPSFHIARRVFDYDVNPLPVISTIPSMEDAAQTRYKNNSVNLPIAFTCLLAIEDGKDVHAICEPILGEMETALFAAGPLTIAGIDDTYFAFNYLGGGVVDYPDELGPAEILITISAEILYSKVAGDPCN